MQTEEDLMVKDFLFILFMLRTEESFLCEAVERKDRDMLIQ